MGEKFALFLKNFVIQLFESIITNTKGQWTGNHRYFETILTEPGKTLHTTIYLLYKKSEPGYAT